MKKLLFIPLALLVFASCQSEKDKAAEKAKEDSIVKMQARQKYYDAVVAAETTLRSSKGSVMDMKLANDALRAYNDFTVNFPNDSMTPEYYFRAADIAQGMRNYQQAAVYLETIIGKYKGYPKYADACFVAAFVYDTYLEDVNHGADRAKQLYQYVIDNYPKSSYADQSKVLIEYVGKPDSLMLNDIIEKGNQQEQAPSTGKREKVMSSASGTKSK